MKKELITIEFDIFKRKQYANHFLILFLSFFFTFSLGALRKKTPHKICKYFDLTSGQFFYVFICLTN